MRGRESTRERAHARDRERERERERKSYIEINICMYEIVYKSMI